MTTIPPTRTTSASSERGVVAVWAALLMGLFMGFSAMAVDLGLWYIERSQVQSATDAAALGGAALLPDEPDSAVAEAIRIAGQHGYEAADVEVRVENNSQLLVTIHGEVDNLFLPAIGFDDTKGIQATARAEFEGAVSMGSPDSELGNDPEQLGVGSYIPDGLYLGVAGPDYTKINGDRYGTKNCGGAYTACASGNAEYDEDGYFFEVEVKADTNRDLLIEVFDPIYAYVNQNCSYQNSNYGLPTSSQIATLTALTATSDYTGGGSTIPQGWFDDAADRYQAGDTEWCPGDFANGVERIGSTTHRMATSFLVREPDDTPWNVYDNPVVASADCQPIAFGAYDTRNSSSWQDGDVYDLLHPVSGPGNIEWRVDPDDGIWTFSETFRRWVTVCRIPQADVKVGSYLLQVRTNADPTNPLVYDPTWYSQGSNQFSIRAGFDNAGVRPDPMGSLSLSAAGRLPIFTNLPNGVTEFYLARVLPTSRQRTLTVELFDAGDIASGSADIRVLPPTDTGAPSTFSGCVIVRDKPGTIQTNTSTCTVQNVSGDYNGTTTLIQVPIPPTYTCDSGSDLGCWVRLQINFTGDAHDFTTWSAFISGDPVRLID